MSMRIYHSGRFALWRRQEETFWVYHPHFLTSSFVRASLCPEDGALSFSDDLPLHGLQSSLEIVREWWTIGPDTSGGLAIPRTMVLNLHVRNLEPTEATFRIRVMAAD